MAAAVMHPAEHSPAGDYALGMEAGEGRPTLLVTTVDIGEGRAGRIEVCYGDDPVDVARAFCARHGLPDTIVLPLAQHLEENLAENAAAAAAAAAAASGEQGPIHGQHPLYADEEPESEGEDYGEYAERHTPGSMHPSEYSGPSMDRRPGSAGSDQSGAPMQRTHEDIQVEPSSRSAGFLGPRPGEQGPAQQGQQAQRPTTAPSYRPAAVHSARGAEYFNRPPPSARSVHDSDVDSSGRLYCRVPGSAGSSGSVPAHTRLYADHFRKQQKLEEERKLRDLEVQLKMEQVHIAPASNKLASQRNAGNYRNYGERLYAEGRLDAMKRIEEAQHVKEEEERAELEQYTFQPSISKLAQQIKAGEGGTGGSMAAGQRLYQRGQGTAKRQERMEAIRREQDEAEVSECSFRPQINSKSARMVEQRQQILRESGLPGFQQLYNDSLRRRRKLEELAARPDEEATFHPQVNTSRVVLKKLMEGREDEEGLLAGSVDVAARLLERGRRYDEKLRAAQRQAEHAPRDAATGQPLFRPKTYRPPQWERNPEGAPIGEYLYSIKAEWDEKAARVLDAQARRVHQNASSTFVNDRSERLVDRLKRERFRAIFDYLRHGSPAPVINLLETVQDEPFMDTIDPEVRADVEFASRLLAKSIARRQVSERLRDCATSVPGGGASLTSAATGALDTSRSTGTFITATTAGAAGSSYGQSTNGEVDASGFVALMEDVIARTRGLTRQYLLPMPSGRQKFEEPTFRPAINAHSLALAMRVRPETLPAYEVLYKTAEEQAVKQEERRRVAEVARLKECIFKPVMVSHPKAQEGRALKMAVELTQSTLQPKRASNSEEGSSHAPLPPQRPAVPAAASRSRTPAVPSPGAAASPAPPPPRDAEQAHFDALEKQINEALVRLSMSEEAVAASLRQAAAAVGPPAGGDAAEAAGAAGVQVGQSVDANGYRLDWRTICASPSPDGMLPLPELGDTPGNSSMAGYNPLDDADGPAGMAPVEDGPSTVAWTHDSQEVVATVVADGSAGCVDADCYGGDSRGASDGAELTGLDLHALASTDLPDLPLHGEDIMAGSGGQ